MIKFLVIIPYIDMWNFVFNFISAFPPPSFSFLLLPVLPVLLIHSLLTHSFTHSLIHSLTHSLTHSLIYSITHSLTHSLTRSFTHSPVHTHTYTHSEHSHKLTHNHQSITLMLPFLFLLFYAQSKSKDIGNMWGYPVVSFSGS